MQKLDNLISYNFLPSNITKYLNWYEIMPFLLTNHKFHKQIDHPFIRNAIRYYKKVDGIKLTRLEPIHLLK